MDRIKGKYVTDTLSSIVRAGKSGLMFKNVTSALNIGPVPISRSTKVLVKEGLITREEAGPFVIYAATKKGVAINKIVKELSDAMDE